MRQFRPQAGDDLKCVGVPLIQRLERDEHAAVVLRRIADSRAEPHRHRVDRRIGHHDLAGLFLQLVHLGERNVLPCLGRPEQDARVLLRKEAFGNDRKEIPGRDHRCDEGHERREAVAEHEIDAAPIRAGQSVKALFAQLVDPSVPLFVAALQKTRRHHRRKR